LGIVIKISIRTELIAIVCAGRIRGLRDGDALVVSARERELSHHPSVCGLIVLDYRITIITGFTRSAEPAPQSVPRCRTVDHVAGGFIKHSERQVDPLYVLRGTYRAVGVRWSYVDVVTGEPFADSFEIKSRSDSDVDSRSCERLQRGVFSVFAPNFLKISKRFFFPTFFCFERSNVTQWTREILPNRATNFRRTLCGFVV